jgi:alginate O-acetyltransferase complex protein AlgI
MLFTSLAFFAFLPVTLLIFAALPHRQRWIALLLASYVFYGFAQPTNLIYLGAVTVFVYGCGRAMAAAEKAAWRKLILGTGLIVILGSLFAFKFYDFIADVALYIAWFPKVLAGPIDRATNFLPQLWQGLRANPDRLVFGLQMIVWGLFKKVVIAENLAPLVDRNFKIAAFAAPMELLISVYFFAFQIYCDFSGYTDIAIGVSAMFGIQLMENFRRPYLARSTAEFWSERWHISLAHWFRDYLYIPLGGSHVGALRRYLNIMVVFMVSGLWHAGLGYGVGWTFLIWGALNGFYNWVGLATRALWRRLGALMPWLAASTALWVMRVLITFHLVAIAWVFFRAKSISDALAILRKIATRLPDLPGLIPHYPFTGEHYLGFGLILFLLAVEIVDEKRPVLERLQASPVWLRWGVNYAAIFGLLVLGRWDTKQFIYMQF